MEIEVSKFYLEIQDHLRSKDRFTLPEECNAKVELFCKHYIDNLTIVKLGTEYWRARIWGLNQLKNYSPQELGAPPSNLASPGRINPQGISFLYGALEENTAISEVRPWVGANISLGKFKVLRDLKLVDLTNEPRKSFNSGEYSDDEILKGLQTSINSIFINKLFFSAPAHEKDDLAYITSQFISERFKIMGADGILYPSVLNENGLNICLFNPSLVEFKGGIRKSTVRAVKIVAT